MDTSIKQKIFIIHFMFVSKFCITTLLYNIYNIKHAKKFFEGGQHVFVNERKFYFMLNLHVYLVIFLRLIMSPLFVAFKNADDKLMVSSIMHAVYI